MDLYDNEGHLSDETLNKLYNEALPLEDKLTCLDHTANCEKCALRYSLLITEDDYRYAPKSLADDVITNIRDKSARKYLLIYNIKVVAVAAAAVLMLFSSVLSPSKIDERRMQMEEKDFSVSSVTNEFREKINEIINNFRELEVLNFEKTKE